MHKSYTNRQATKKRKSGKIFKKIKEKQLGFIPANSDLDNLEVLVLGINSKNPNNPYALDIIEIYWSDWFEKMGVQKYKIKKLDISSSIEKVIADFIN